MPTYAAPRCRHIKVNGTQCGSPALCKKNFCFYHQEDRPNRIECYYKPDEYPTGEIILPYFEDAHSIQSVIRQTVQMVLQKRLGEKTANLVLYALQIASSNLKRMDHEKPQPEQLVTDVEQKTKRAIPIAAPLEGEAAREIPPAQTDDEPNQNDETPPLGTIQACYQPDYRRSTPASVRVARTLLSAIPPAAVHEGVSPMP